MAKIAGGQLAAAVAAGGGLGFLGGGYGDTAWLDREVQAAGDARFGIGLITWNIGPAEVEAALSYSPAAFWLSFDDPRTLAPLVHQAGIPLVCQVGSKLEAQQALDAGASILVAQGNESGGHGQSNRALFGLLPELAEMAGAVPVVAAGGINGPAGYRAALALGAGGVALGTRLYATAEALDSDQAKHRLVEANGDDTVRSVVYDLARGPEWPPAYDGRSLRTEWTDRWAGREDEMRPDLDRISAEHVEAAARSDMTKRVVWAGEGVDGIESIPSAVDVVASFPEA